MSLLYTTLLCCIASGAKTTLTTRFSTQIAESAQGFAVQCRAALSSGVMLQHLSTQHLLLLDRWLGSDPAPRRSKRLARRWRVALLARLC
jgi:hypothetical protein